jgi:glycosyltransferase involved in cell wall biosynthesis
MVSLSSRAKSSSSAAGLLPHSGGLLAIETHPVQYHAPVYRAVQEQYSIPVTAIYGSDFSVAGYRDAEFGCAFSWDTDLLSGYTPVFLSKVSKGGARSHDSTSTRGLSGALRAASPSAVLLTGYSPSFHRKAFFHAQRLGVPLLFRGETTDHIRQCSRLKALARRSALGWFYRRCSRLLYIGQRSQEHFRSLGVAASKLTFSPYCVNATVFQHAETFRPELRASIRNKLNIANSDTVMLFSGKLSPVKRPDLIVRAIKVLDQPLRSRIVLVFLGSGEMEGALQALAAAAPTVRASFVGFHNQSQLSPFYHAADILALPSQSETWGLVVNEALHHGLPCVVSDTVGCAPDLIEAGKTGELATAGSIEDLAEALRRALALTGRAEIRDRCRERVNKYTVAKAAEGIALAYQAVIRR